MTDDMDGSTIDVAGVVSATGATLDIRAGPLQANFQEGESGGVRVFQDGAWLSIAQGVDYPDGDKATVAQDLTVESARELAQILMDAADEVEARQQHSNDSDAAQTGSLAWRVVGVFQS